MFSKPRRLGAPRFVLGLVLLLLGLALLPLVWPSLKWPGFLPCAVRSFLGVDCPGCGLLRSLSHLYRLEWGAAVRLYPLGPFIGLFLVAFVGDELLGWFRGRPGSLRAALGPPWITLVLSLIFAQWIAKLLGIW